MNARVRFAVLVSGAGTNLARLIDDVGCSDHPGTLALVIGSDADIPALAIAHAAQIPTLVIRRSDFSRREWFDARLVEALRTADAQWVVLAGFRWLLGETVLREFPNRVLNVHPSLLPSFPGRNATAQAIAAGATVSGATVHIVDAGVDSGPPVARGRVPVLDGDRDVTLHARIQEVEHRLLPIVLRWALLGRIRIPAPDGALPPKCTVLDGGLATSLQREGLPPFTTPSDWVFDRPDAVRRAHHAFAVAGASIGLSATLTALPHLDARWEDRIARAIALVATAAPEGQTWASVGPATRGPERFAHLSSKVQATLRASWAAAAKRAASSGATGIALETFVDPDELYAAVAAVKSATTLPTVGSLCPDDEGRAQNGTPVGEIAAALLGHGADIVGFNCGLTPASVFRAARAVPEDVPLWVKPARWGPLPAALTEFEFLARRCQYVGGCCGTSPADIAAIHAICTGAEPPATTPC